MPDTTEAALAEEAAPEEMMPIPGYIDQLTEEQILLLTDQDLQRMITLRKAWEGIKMIEPPLEPTYHVIPEKDLTFYSVTGSDWAFTDLESANQIAQVLGTLKAKARRCSRYSDSDGYEVETSIDVSTFQVYSAALWAKVSGAIKENKELKTDYEKQKKEYDHAVEGSEWIRDEVYARYNAVIRKYREMDEMLRQFRNYVQIAEGDEEIAWKFLKKAFPINEETENYVRLHANDQVAPSA